MELQTAGALWKPHATRNRHRLVVHRQRPFGLPRGGETTITHKAVCVLFCERKDRLALMQLNKDLTARPSWILTVGPSLLSHGSRSCQWASVNQQKTVEAVSPLKPRELGLGAVKPSTQAWGSGFHPSHCTSSQGGRRSGKTQTESQVLDPSGHL